MEQPARRAQRIALRTESLPHSWGLRDWPAHVYPNSMSAGKNLVRKHQAELVRCGALARIDRKLTVLGAGFAVFLAGKMGNVSGYVIPPNRKRTETAIA